MAERQWLTATTPVKTTLPRVLLASEMQWIPKDPVQRAESPSPQDIMCEPKTHQCSYAKFSLWCAMHHLAWIEPPRLTMPVKRLAVCGTKDSSTPAWMVK